MCVALNTFTSVESEVTVGLKLGKLQTRPDYFSLHHGDVVARVGVACFMLEVLPQICPQLLNCPGVAQFLDPSAWNIHSYLG